MRRFAISRRAIGWRFRGRWHVLQPAATAPLFTELWCADTRVVRLGPLKLVIRPRPGLRCALATPRNNSTPQRT